MSVEFIDIHASTLPRWATCESSALFHLLHPRERSKTHIAAWIGQSVHALVAGDDPPPEPDAVWVRFDRTTPSMSHARQQVKVLRRAVEDLMRDEGLAIIKREHQVSPFRDSAWVPHIRLVGRLDVYAYHHTARHVLIDIKTSLASDTAWLQMGAYALCMIEGGYQVDDVAVLHVPRSASVRWYDGTDRSRLNSSFDRRPAAPFVAMARVAMRRISDLMDAPALAVVAPGAGCRYCENTECPVKTA